VSTVQTSLQKLKFLWVSAWPIVVLVLFACAVAADWLPAGYARAAVAAPILLMGPGSLTLGAIFGADGGPRRVVFFCYSTLLSVIWFGIVSLALYLLGVLLTTESMYWSLLVVCATLATVAQARLGLKQARVSSWAAHSTESLNPRPPGLEALAGPCYAIVAVAAGLSLLVGGVYLQAHLSHPAPAGYTWLAWEHPQGTGEFTVGPAGSRLPFEIVQRQAGLTSFQVSAAWQGRPAGSLAKPMALRLGPNQTFHATLLVPPLPRGCTNRVVITLTATRQLDPYTRRSQSWSINAGVQGRGRPRKTCQ
jgi:hypothetical protein